MAVFGLAKQAQTYIYIIQIVVEGMKKNQKITKKMRSDIFTPAPQDPSNIYIYRERESVCVCVCVKKKLGCLVSHGRGKTISKYYNNNNNSCSFFKSIAHGEKEM